MRTHPKTAAGFTLIEVLVVVVIAGVITSVAVLSLGDRSEQKLDAETRRFTSLLEMARDEAVLKSSQIGLGFWERGYQFFVQVYPPSDGKQAAAEPYWQLITQDRLLYPRKFPDVVLAELFLQGVKTTLEPNPPDTPSIFILNSGEMMPFELILSLDQQERQQRIIRADNLGKLSLESDSEF